jgi:hypothetical protein
MKNQKILFKKHFLISKYFRNWKLVGCIKTLLEFKIAPSQRKAKIGKILIYFLSRNYQLHPKYPIDE